VLRALRGASWLHVLIAQRDRQLIDRLAFAFLRGEAIDFIASSASRD
jgi:hypothetical protein